MYVFCNCNMCNSFCNKERLQLKLNNKRTNPNSVILTGGYKLFVRKMGVIQLNQLHQIEYRDLLWSSDEHVCRVPEVQSPEWHGLFTHEIKSRT